MRFFNGFLADLLGHPLITPVLAHLGMKEILVDGCKFGFQHFVQNGNNSCVAFHGLPFLYAPFSLAGRGIANQNQRTRNPCRRRKMACLWYATLNCTKARPASGYLPKEDCPKEDYKEKAPQPGGARRWCLGALLQTLDIVGDSFGIISGNAAHRFFVGHLFAFISGGKKSDNFVRALACSFQCRTHFAFASGAMTTGTFGFVSGRPVGGGGECGES